MSRKHIVVLIPLFVAVVSSDLHADDVLLNEWNAVNARNSIADGDAFFGTELAGNGGNWIELLTVKDVDMRGWQLRWTEQEPAANGDLFSEGTLTFSNADLWSTIQAGSIIAIIESEDADGQGVLTGTDISYNPSEDDWTINISTFAELDSDTRLVTTVTNDGIDSEFSVGNSDWSLTILDAVGNIVSGPTGEGALDVAGNALWSGGGISNSEAGALEGPGRGSPSACWESISSADDFYDDTKSSSFGLPNVDFVADIGSYRTTQDLTALRGEDSEGFGDFDSSGEYDLADIDVLTTQIISQSHSPCYDLTSDGLVDFADLKDLVVNRIATHLGDVDLDGDVDEVDYEIWDTWKFTVDNTWGTGDFNADGNTDGADFNIWNANKTIGGFAIGNVSVPEPKTSVLGWLSVPLAIVIRRRSFPPGSLPRRESAGV